LAPFALSACATKADVRDLRESIVELSAQQNAILRELQAQQRAQVDSLAVLQRGVLDFRGEALRRMMSIEDQLLRTQELAGLSQQELSRLRDQLERDRAAACTPQGFPSTEPGGGQTAGEIYTSAQTALRTGGLTAARMGFQLVVESYPNDPLTPEARYYLADILEQEGDREAAVVAFLAVQEYHPSAPRVPDALYRAASLQLQLGNREDARSLFDRVVNTWPESGAASLAREALRNL
jgi:tol-pal system protein YbgF